MKIHRLLRHAPRRNTLATCLVTALSVAAVPTPATAQTVAPHAMLHGAVPGVTWPAVRPGAARAHVAAGRALSYRPAMTQAVTSCADDGSAGTLRDIVASAVSGDVIDLSQLQCSTITLTAGQIEVEVDDLTLQGPGQHALTIDGNHASRVIANYGGAVGSATLALNDLTLANGLVEGFLASGGCLYSYAFNPDQRTILNRATISGCTAGGETSQYALGGGLLVWGSLELHSSTVKNNRAEAPGGGVAAIGGSYVVFGSTVIDSTISGNSAGSAGAEPVGVAAVGGLLGSDTLILRSTISGNHAEGDIGAAMFGPPRDLPIDATIDIIDSTISGNTSAGRVGGIETFMNRATTSATLRIHNSTIAFNAAAQGCGSIGMDGNGRTDVELHSSIVANNTGAGGANEDLCDLNSLTGAVTGANNLVTAADLPLPVDTISADPLLGPLQYNGGATLTHALLPGSPAIEHGNNIAILNFDQRGPGYRRVVGAAADIGAFEVGADGIFGDSFDRLPMRAQP